MPVGDIVDQQQEQQRIPRLGSEVRFEDGMTAGRVRALNEDTFVVIRGKKRIRRLVLPYASIASIGNRVVILRASRADVLERRSRLLSGDRELITKKRFLRELDQRLELDNMERAERIARITLYLMSKRLSPEQKKQLKKSLPAGIRSLWAVVEQQGSEQYFDACDFLAPIKKQGKFETMEEAYIAAREVFSSLKRIMTSVEALEISRSLPRGLQDIWESAV
ncbi:MAG TPA: DUF2267 domain-containing protein [Nitrososphaerales archaeon]|nr:DUF2267 domain-containing protein [Nitrososphaerales archaeon]